MTIKNAHTYFQLSFEWGSETRDNVRIKAIKYMALDRVFWKGYRPALLYVIHNFLYGLSNLNFDLLYKRVRKK